MTLSPTQREAFSFSPAFHHFLTSGPAHTLLLFARTIPRSSNDYKLTTSSRKLSLHPALLQTMGDTASIVLLKNHIVFLLLVNMLGCNCHFASLWSPLACELNGQGLRFLMFIIALVHSRIACTQ